MCLHSVLFVVIAGLLPGLAAASGVLIESVDEQGRHSTVLIQDDRARIDNAIADGYMIIDLANRQAFAVDTAQRLVMDLATPFVPRSAHAAAASRPPLPEVRLHELGPGPTLHGYATVRYQVSVAGRHCFDEYLAPAAAADPRIRRFLATVARLSDPTDEARHNLLFSDADPCDVAADTIDDRYEALGLPLRTVRADGGISHEIIRIVLDAPIETARLAWPDDYPLLSRRQVHERLARQRDGRAELTEALERNQRIQTQIRDLTQ